MKAVGYSKIFGVRPQEILGRIGIIHTMNVVAFNNHVNHVDEIYHTRGGDVVIHPALEPFYKIKLVEVYEERNHLLN